MKDNIKKEGVGRWGETGWGRGAEGGGRGMETDNIHEDRERETDDRERQGDRQTSRNTEAKGVSETHN